jgi:sulfide:quinone oxidoreductase
VRGAEHLRDVLTTFSAGRAVVGVCGAPFKCPPAPSEAAILLHESLEARGVRNLVDITLVLPFGSPIPPSPETSKALLQVFEVRRIRFLPERRVVSLDPASKAAALDDGTVLPYDLFLGIPVHRAPRVVEDSGLAVDGWVPVDPATLATRFPDVYAIGDVNSVGTPKAGVFAEGAARVVAKRVIARIRDEQGPGPYDGKGSCYIEFGGDLVGRVDVDFLGGQGPTGSFIEPSSVVTAEKREFAAARLARWFGPTASG